MPSRRSLQLLLTLVFSLSLAACQGSGNRAITAQGTALLEQLPRGCSDSILAFREAVAQDQVRNAAAPMLSSNPLLHSNRFLSGLSNSVESESEIRQWLSLLADLAIRVRASENQNLSSPWDAASLEELATCSRSFATSARFEQGRRSTLRAVQSAQYPTHYMRSRQALGALPLLRPLLRQRILSLQTDERKWHEEDEFFMRSNSYQIDVEQGTQDRGDSRDWMHAAYASNELELPLLEESQLKSLFIEHAPSLQIEFEDDSDTLVVPIWRDGRLNFNKREPRVHTLASMTRFEGRNLLQLNYVFWFSQRKPMALIDLYSGLVDSIIWRVTLDEQGKVLLYDSIHSCGCYHKYFLASDSISEKSIALSKEPANIFRLKSDPTVKQIALTITAGEHYIVGVESASSFAEQERLLYTLAPYEELQNLKVGTGSKSLFDERGLIPGSERLERFTLWPTGILSVGAMRQWGTHATGFIEEQHFDDVNLLDSYFESTP